MSTDLVKMLLVSGLLGCFGTACWGQDLAAEAESEQWYTVELLVFAYSKRDPDYYPVPREMPVLDGLIELAGEDVETGSEEQFFSSELLEPDLPSGIMVEEAKEAPEEQPFVSLSGDSFSLAAAAKRLRSHPSYRPLAHLAWRQPEYEFLKGPDVHVHGGRSWRDPESFYSAPFHTMQQNPDELQSFNDELEGSVSLTHGRFNHLEIDLVLHLPDQSSRRASPWIGRRDERQATAFLIRQQRRIHLDRLQYFDHPQFGVLALVSAYDRKPPETDAPPVDDQEGVLVYPNTGS